MAFAWFKPTRTQETSGVEIVSDLDRLIAEPVGIRLFGKTYVIEAITTRQFALLAKRFAALSELQRKAKESGVIPEDEMIQEYFRLFKTCCGKITYRDVLDMTPAQRAGFIQVIVDAMRGRAHVKADSFEKKNPLNPNPTSE